jgi:ureidoglycolate hydrolase
MPDTRVVSCTPLTAESFAPFGQLLAAEPDEALIEVRDGEEWILNVLTYEHHDLVCDHLNAHHKATQALLPMGSQPALLVVAPPGTTFAEPADLDTIRAFVMDGTAGVNLAFGTWHWGPYPIGPRVDLLNLQGRGFADDNEIVNLVDLLDTVVVARL